MIMILKKPERKEIYMFAKLVKTTALVTLITVAAQASAKIESGKFNIDPMHSKVGFEIPHLVISTVEGSFKTFEGTVEIDPTFSKSKVEAEVQISSIDTGVAKRDDHLKSADFFDEKKHPKMIFKSTAIKGTPESFKLEGDLTMHGTKKPVVFEGKFLGAVTDGYGNRKVAFKVTAKINRQDFGLKWSSVVEAGPVVGDEVTITLNIQAAKQAEKPAGKK